jgi:hypothetical protein
MGMNAGKADIMGLGYNAKNTEKQLRSCRLPVEDKVDVMPRMAIRL